MGESMKQSMTVTQDDETMGGSDDEWESENDSDSEDLPEAIYDPMDCVYRCSECTWEVVDGYCQHCDAAYVIYEGREDRSQDASYRIVATEYDAINPDRRLAPRSTTPLRRMGRLLDADIPRTYLSTSRKAEYRALLARGASRAMCELYELEFHEESGIVAWATDAIFDEFAGPDMKSGDTWKIYLGRRVVLDPEDEDGTLFVETLLEEALFYPLHVEKLCPGEMWETILGEPGVWATKPTESDESHAGRYLGKEEMDEALMEEHWKALDELALEEDEALYMYEEGVDGEWTRTEKPKHSGPVKRTGDYEPDSEYEEDQSYEEDQTDDEDVVGYDADAVGDNEGDAVEDKKGDAVEVSDDAGGDDTKIDAPDWPGSVWPADDVDEEYYSEEARERGEFEESSDSSDAESLSITDHFKRLSAARAVLDRLERVFQECNLQDVD